MENVGVMQCTDTKEQNLKTTGKTASSAGRRVCQNTPGLRRNENLDGSNNTWCGNHLGLKEQGFLRNDHHRRVSRS